MIRFLLTLCLFFSPILLATAEIEPKEIKLTASNSDQFSIYVFLPSSSVETDSAIITVHGGGWRWGDAKWTFNASRRFTEEGLISVAIDYRLSRDNITPIDAKEDICTTLKWLRSNHKRYDINPNKIAAHGVSAGGQLISLAATKGCGNNLGSKHNGGPDLLSLWSPALDMERDGWFKKLLKGQEKAVDNSPLATINDNMPATIIIQGELDTLTPTASASAFCEQIKNKGKFCKLKVYPGVGHLLTRNLQNQESNFDPHPEYVQDGFSNIIQFLETSGYTKTSK